MWHQKTNKANESFTVLRRATVLDPKNEKAWITLGVCLQQDMKMADATHCYQKTLN